MHAGTYYGQITFHLRGTVGAAKVGHMITSRQRNQVRVHDDSTGQIFHLNTYTYDSFYAGYDPNFNHELKETEINGHAAALITKGDDPDSLCTLYWNDGCHFAVLMSQLKDYETMRFIAENLETD